MASDLFTRKMDRLFKSLDVTGDGLLGKDDHDILIQGVIGAAGVVDGERYRMATDAFWDALVLVDGFESGVNSEQFVAAVRRVVRDEGRYDELVVPMNEFGFSMFDADGDGALQFAEYEQIMRAFQHSDSDVRAWFDRLDTDCDGRITRAEWMALVKDYYLSDDPEAPGNYVNGPV